jgi:prepilin-type N-terminal cleavage/methylation domain-containing protein
MSQRSAKRGYTAVEVLAAMTLFAIGAAGVIGMQRVTIQGGQDARRLDIATNIAHEWVARLQRDSTNWTQPSSKNPDVTNVYTATKWLTNVQTASCQAPNWCTPPAPTGAPEGFAYAFDVFGRDRAPTSVDANGQPDHHYCVQYRMWWGRPLGAAAPFNEQATIHADIRVFYSRQEQLPIGRCSTAAINGITPDSVNYREAFHMVYASTVLRSAQEAPQ